MVLSCFRKDSAPLAYNSTIILDNNQFVIRSAEEFENFLKVIVGKTGISIEEYDLTKMHDNTGEYTAIRAKYSTKDNQKINLVVPLAESQVNTTLTSNHYLVLCTMSCSPNQGCAGCDQVIVEKCVSQTCDCNTIGASCSSSITFN